MSTNSDRASWRARITGNFRAAQPPDSCLDLPREDLRQFPPLPRGNCLAACRRNVALFKRNERNQRNGRRNVPPANRSQLLQIASRQLRARIPSGSGLGMVERTGSDRKILPPLWAPSSVLGSRRTKLFPLPSSMNEIRWMGGRVGTNVGTDLLRRKSVLTLGLDLGRPLLREE